MTKKEENLQSAEEVVKINKWDGAAVKHALDDAVKNAIFLERPNIKEQFGLINTRLFICSLAVGIAIVAHGWDFTHPFPESQSVLLFSAISYFALMGILTLHTTFREKGIFVVAVQKDGNSQQRTWIASSDMKKYDDKYVLTLSLRDAKSLREATSSKSCANYIDVNGVIIESLVNNDVNRLFNSLSAGKKEQ